MSRCCESGEVERTMVTDNSSVGAAHNTTNMFGSGLSGMVAAYIGARALEDEAYRNEDWSAERVFRPKLPKWRPRKTSPGESGPALAP